LCVGFFGVWWRALVVGVCSGGRRASLCFVAIARVGGIGVLGPRVFCVGVGFGGRGFGYGLGVLVLGALCSRLGVRWSCRLSCSGRVAGVWVLQRLAFRVSVSSNWFVSCGICLRRGARFGCGFAVWEVVFGVSGCRAGFLLLAFLRACVVGRISVGLWRLWVLCFGLGVVGGYQLAHYDQCTIAVKLVTIEWQWWYAGYLRNCRRSAYATYETVPLASAEVTSE